MHVLCYKECFRMRVRPRGGEARGYDDIGSWRGTGRQTRYVGQSSKIDIYI
jgi:hypothetical protein